MGDHLPLDGKALRYDLIGMLAVIHIGCTGPVMRRHWPPSDLGESPVTFRTFYRRSLRSTALALLPVGLLALPAVAASDTKPVNGFKPIERPLTPGERAAANRFVSPTEQAAAAAALALDGGRTERLSSTGFDVTFSGRSFNGGLLLGNSGFGTRRSNQLLGDGQIGYDAEPFFSNNRSYYSPYGYHSATPRLNYNQAFMRHLYGGNIAGAPSVSAPLEFWDGRR